MRFKVGDVCMIKNLLITKFCDMIGVDDLIVIERINFLKNHILISHLGVVWAYIHYDVADKQFKKIGKL